MKKLLTLLALIPLCGYAQTDQLDSLFTSLFINKQFYGNVLIAKKGEIIFEKSYGLANVQTKEKLDSNSMFELASVSKQFTAMGIVLLKKERKLNYNDPITKFIPELKFYDTISIDNLIHHTSGLPDYMDLLNTHWDKTKFATNQDIVNQFVTYKPKLEFKPGEKFAYSNTGYALLALIIEKASGQSFEDYLKQKIFEPLKMQRTTVYRSRYAPREINNYANSYFTVERTDEKVSPNCFGKDYKSYYLDGIVGDGTVNSTAVDLLKWDRALFTYKLISKEETELIFKSGKTKNGKETGYGFGWFVSNNDKYGRVVSHSGGWAGYTTYIGRDLDKNVTIILLQNVQSKNTTIPSKSVREILYNMLPPKPTEEDLHKVAGKYIWDNGDTTEFVLENSKLFSLLIPDKKLEMTPLSTSKFKLVLFGYDIFVEFKQINPTTRICILEQPISSVKKVGVKSE